MRNPLRQLRERFHPLFYIRKSSVGRIGTVGISLITIDDERSRRPRVDLLKNDVEGHEAAVLRGAQQSISSAQPVLFIECFHPGHACLQALETRGYRFVDGDRLTA
jgi:hypothetical protein